MSPLQETKLTTAKMALFHIVALCLFTVTTQVYDANAFLHSTPHISFHSDRCPTKYCAQKDNEPPLDIDTDTDINIDIDRKSGKNPNPNPMNLSEEKKKEQEQWNDLMPPEININFFQSSSSLLFSENPVTKENNGPLRIWKQVKSIFPPVMTGAWTTWTGRESISVVGDDNPIGALYNMVFVRFPAIGMFGVYTKNLLQDKPLIIDFGYGPFEVSPIIVYSVMFVILGPGPQYLSQEKELDE